MTIKNVYISSDVAPAPVYLGRVGEYGVTTVRIDLSAFIDEYGQGSAELFYVRPSEKIKYPAPTNQIENYIDWVVDNFATEIVGEGKAEVWFYPANGLKKSFIFSTVVIAGLMGSEPEEVPEAMTSWLENATQTMADVKASVPAVVEKYVTEHKEDLRGDKGEQGEQGIPGPKGDPFTFEDFTPEQLEELSGKVDYNLVYSKEETDRLIRTSLEQTYNKEEVDALVKNVGKIKTVNGTAPDVNGNIQISYQAANQVLVDLWDLKDYYSDYCFQVGQYAGIRYGIRLNIDEIFTKGLGNIPNGCQFALNRYNPNAGLTIYIYNKRLGQTLESILIYPGDVIAFSKFTNNEKKEDSFSIISNTGLWSCNCKRDTLEYSCDSEMPRSISEDAIPGSSYSLINKKYLDDTIATLPSGLPEVSVANNGEVLVVNNGEWVNQPLNAYTKEELNPTIEAASLLSDDDLQLEILAETDIFNPIVDWDGILLTNMKGEIYGI